jgi:hypothetical protein
LSNVDIGCLLIEDCRSYEGLAQKDFDARTQANLCSLYQHLFDLKKQQKLDDGGEDGEILEYTKSKWNVRLPESKVTLPRQHPPPKQKPLTKWEKFRIEKGLM